MRSIWQSLAWKEWHEHKWKLAALTAVLCGTNAVFLGLQPPEFFSGCFWVTLLSIVPLAVFIGASAAAGERSRSTASFLDALPVPSWKPALNKLLAGALTLTSVVAFTFLFVFVVFRCWSLMDPTADISLDNVREPPLVAPLHVGSWYVNSALTIAAVALSLFSWTIAAGVNRSDEVSAGAKAILTIVIWWTLLAILGLQVDQKWFEGGGKPIVAALVEMSPAGGCVMFPKNQSAVAWAGTPLPAICGLALHLGLAAWFLWRFERPGREWNIRFRFHESAGATPYWPRPPRRSQLGAIAWKQFRESGPVLLAGLAGILGASGLAICIDSQLFKNNPLAITEVYAGVTAGFSFFIAIVVGIGVSLNDTLPEVNTFWRSRPIDPDRWYWTKFTTGIGVLFVTLYLPVLILASIGHLFGYDEVWNALWDPGILFLVAAVVAIYVAAVTMMLLLRHAVYAAILSIAVVYIGCITVVLFVGVVRWILWRQPLSTWRDVSANDPSVIGGLFVLTALVIMTGWLATRYDWGRKSRY